MSKLYEYTLYRTDGSLQALAPQAGLHPEDIEAMLGGSMDVAPPELYASRHLGSRNQVTVYTADYHFDAYDDLDPNPHFPEFNGNVLVEKLHKTTEDDKHAEAKAE